MTRVNPKRKKARAGYMISAVAELYKLHPQTLRLYERVGLLKPSRSEGNTRLYTDSDLERLEVILTLTREMGVNLAGIEIILNMREKIARNAHPDGSLHRLRAPGTRARPAGSPPPHAPARRRPRARRSPQSDPRTQDLNPLNPQMNTDQH